MRTVKQTRIARKRKEQEFNQQFILREGMSEDEYNNLWLDSGYEFLHRIFKNHAQLFKEIHADRLFWNWWRSEFKKKEKEIIDAFNLLGEELIIDYYKSEIMAMAICPILEQDFMNYQNCKKHD